ncbi:hypothetical protein N7527_001506 [Penicillium freii]|nr:hypothetical protein N7527_001506 [Penicillium freii]
MAAFSVLLHLSLGSRHLGAERGRSRRDVWLVKPCVCIQTPTGGVFRKVLVEGIKTENGIELPKGAYVSFLGRPLQCNPETFEDPFKYDPFRFSRVREKAPRDEKGRSITSNLSFVSTSPEHLPFGHGGHSCPGRFLVDFEVKMIVAYLLMNYDVEFLAEYNGQRPANRWMAEALMLPSGARIRIKRRS